MVYSDHICQGLKKKVHKIYAIFFSTFKKHPNAFNYVLQYIFIHEMFTHQLLNCVALPFVFTSCWADNHFTWKIAECLMQIRQKHSFKKRKPLWQGECFFCLKPFSNKCSFLSVSKKNNIDRQNKDVNLNLSIFSISPWGLIFPMA